MTGPRIAVGGSGPSSIVPPDACSGAPLLMILSFAWPSTPQYSGGVVALYEFANALARRGHDVHFIHGPAWKDRIDRIEQLSWFSFAPTITHHIVDSYDDPSLPEGDVVFSPWVPHRLGLPMVFVQGHLMMARQIERSAFRARCPKICIASWLADVLVDEYGVPPEQVLHVPLGIDHGLFTVTTPIEHRPVDIALLHHLHPAKGWEVGRDAVAAVRRHRPDLRVDVFGIVDPPERIPSWMRFHLNLDRPALARRIGQARVFVQPSWYEGFGFTAVEAMACGCALVSTDNGGSRDYALDGATALVVEPGNDAAMADAIEALLADDERRLALARSGTEHVRRFDWDRGAEQLEAALLAYVAAPARFQGSPEPSDEPDTTFTFIPGALVPRPLGGSASARSPATAVPDDRQLVWNVVMTGITFTLLQYFISSLIANSGSRFRLVANGCPPEQVHMMERYGLLHPDRVLEVLTVSSDAMVAHGVALDRVREHRHDGDWFCMIDPDIKANRSFVGDLAGLLADHDAVTSGKEVWTGDNLVPVGHQGVAGEFFFDQDGFVFGSPHLAIYRRTALDGTSERWGVGLGSAGPDLRESARARLAEMGHTYLIYDTGKIVNALLQADGHRLVHRDLPQLVHIGGLAHYISPSEYRRDERDEEVPDWTQWESMSVRHEVTRYTARTLERLVAGDAAPDVPSGLDRDVEDRLRLVRREIDDLVGRYGPRRSLT